MAAQMLNRETTASHVLQTSQNLGFSLQGELFSGNGIIIILLWFCSFTANSNFENEFHMEHKFSSIVIYIQL